MFLSRCPNEERLARHAEGGMDRRVARHVTRCDACRVRLEQLRSNEAFLADLRQAIDASIDPAERPRLTSLWVRPHE